MQSVPQTLFLLNKFDFSVQTQTRAPNLFQHIIFLFVVSLGRLRPLTVHLATGVVMIRSSIEAL